ncbi:glyoxylase-like metal-dependent hydrolase (beta-lactamase superfamily II) [Chitinophaga polysaccharea]|uniref:Glyoxylase-like metal-dependent hydrolase (Beta-lactamase superfamily II) n=1 Tax=Chitinophaga polysaccharea TaxID=1293035 RepID=A0A561PB55_9BACT|nr:MBL fold metallo-hydrolase [Chitinophaga polysaccharea]TWF35371.1 glyoxylase-like metal-dependent hydrolase (beta-lactamase superfamily II) [Chitinophaga polysaccharea]
MDIQQFEDKGLAHYSYAIYSDQANEIVLIDPARDMTPYLDYAAQQQAKIVGVIETHPHADFVSSHLELQEATGAAIYCSRLVGAGYPYTGFDEGDEISLGDITLRALNTPGHSPDSISIVLAYKGQDSAVFTGDTLFIGDCGRPDLRENAGNITAGREQLAKQMYHSLREKLMVLADDVLVYPAHGAGTLCGKSLSDADSSTIAAEKVSNWSLGDYTEAEFVKELLSQQPFIPKYFPYDVTLNRSGALALESQLNKVPVITSGEPVFEPGVVIIDTRPEAVFKQGHVPLAVNLQDGGKFETWLGSIVAPGESYYLLAAGTTQLQQVIRKAAKIGYEVNIKAAMVYDEGTVTLEQAPLADFTAHPDQYTVVDVRMAGEAATSPVFSNALVLPLDQLREHIADIPVDKPIVVHCAGGYRSAAASSIIAAALQNKVTVYDLGEAVKTFLP